MSDYLLINSLSESRVFRSKDSLMSFGPAEKDELLLAILLSVVACSLDSSTVVWAREYASKTAAFSNFSYFRSSATDLYALLYDADSQNRLSGVERQSILRLLKEIGRGTTDLKSAQQTILRLEQTLTVKNGQIRAARRVVLNWFSKSTYDRENAVKQLLSSINKITNKAEVIPYLKILKRSEPGKLGKGSTFKKAAALAGAGLAGLVLGYELADPSKPWGIFKEDLDVLEEDRPTQLFNLIQLLPNHPQVEKVISVNYLSDGISALVRTTDGNAYEFEIRPAPFAKGHQHKTGVKESQEVDEWFWRVRLHEQSGAKLILTPKDVEKHEKGLSDGMPGDKYAKDHYSDMKTVGSRYDVDFVHDFDSYTDGVPNGNDTVIKDPSNPVAHRKPQKKTKSTKKRKK